jgi:hypothetical protein
MILAHSEFGTGHCKRSSCYAKHPGGTFIIHTITGIATTDQGHESARAFCVEKEVKTISFQLVEPASQKAQNRHENARQYIRGGRFRFPQPGRWLN